MTRIFIAIFLAAFTAPALAQQQQAPDPTTTALVQMLQESQGREAQANVQVHVLRAQLAAEKKRADEASAMIRDRGRAIEPAEKPADVK